MKMLVILLALMSGQDKLKPPSAADQKRAEKQVKDLFPVEYSKREKPERLLFAQKLLESASNPKDEDVVRWILLREAGSISAECQDLVTSFTAAARRAEIFDIKLDALREAAVQSAKKAVKGPEDAADLTESYLKLGAEALKAEDFDGASRWAKDAEECGRGAKNQKYVDRAKELSISSVEAKKGRKILADAEAAIVADEKNADANLAIGRYWCFVKGDWQKGLPYIEKGSDEQLRIIASLEITKPPTPEEQTWLADAWWDASLKKALDKQIFQERARFWYEAALRKASGILKAKIEKRLAEAPAPLNGFSLLKYVDVKKAVGEWKLDGQALLSPKAVSGVPHRAEIQFYPGMEYDLTLTAELKEGGGHFLVGLVGGGRKQFMIDVYDSVCGLTILDGKHYDQNETTARGKFVTKDTPLTVVFSVRRAGVEVQMNGVQVINWKGDFAKFSIEGWKVGSDKSLFIGSCGLFQFTRVLFTSMSGDAKPLK